MPEKPCLLILGGTGDAAALAKACAHDFPHLRTISSLAGRTHRPALLAGETHIGGFGGAPGLETFLRQNAVHLVVDATHPFAAQMSRHAALACDRLGIARLQFTRPAWNAARGDRWLEVRDMTAAATQVASVFAANDARVFLSTGRQQLAAFEQLRNTWFLIRTVERLDSPVPLTHYEALIGRGPFSVDQERALLEQHRIDVLVSKNSGGDATYAKILAARSLSLPVIMLRRPAPPPGPAVDTLGDAIAWLQSHL